GTDGDFIAIRYTYGGDANFTGTVDTTDFTLMAANFNKTGQTWINGDFNYDGVVNALDFNFIATNFGATAIASPALGTLVPEPMSLSIIACAILGLSGIRPRKRR